MHNDNCYPYFSNPFWFLFLEMTRPSRVVSVRELLDQPVDDSVGLDLQPGPETVSTTLKIGRIRYTVSSRPSLGSCS